MSDNTAEFTVRLVDQVMGPSKSIQKQMRDVNKTFEVVKRSIEAPASKRGALSDWDKMLSKAKLSQASDFAKQNARVVSAQNKASAASDKGGFFSKLFGVVGGGGQGGSGGGGMTAMIGMMGPEGAAIAMIIEGVKAVVGKVSEAIHVVADLGIEFTQTALEAAKFGERSTLAIGFLTDNALHAGTVFDDVRHQAQALGLDVQDTVGAFQKLLAAQFTVGESKSLIKMGADMQAIGASAEEVQRIIYAMSEIKSIGTLQKRQERMLQMAGISGQLIDRALMKRTGIKTEGGLQLARKKNLIGADVAIEAVKDAVMSKTHERALGDTGKAFANSTLAGMQSQLGAGLENFWIDVGQKMLPGATRVAKLVADAIGKLANDPQLASLGDFMLAKFEALTVWVQANWPVIEDVLVVGLHATADAMRFVVDVFDTGSVAFKVIRNEAYAVGAAISLMAGGFIGLPQAIESGMASLGADMGRWLVHFVDRWGQAGRDMIGGLIDGLLSGLGPLGNAVQLIASLVPTHPQGNGLVAIPGMKQPYTEIRPDMPTGAGIPASGSTGAALLALSGAGGGKTEAGKETTGHTVHIGEIVQHFAMDAVQDPSAFAAKIAPAVRAELQKVFETHS